MGCHCAGPESVKKSKPRWCPSTAFLAIVWLSCPPLALPFIWIHPKRSVLWKFFWTVVTVAVSYGLWKYASVLIPQAMERWAELRQELGL